MTRVGDYWGLGGRTALVTGASSGLGRHFVDVLVGEGARVVAVARRIDRLRELESKHGTDRVFGIAVDLQDRSAIRAAGDAIATPFGEIDLLVNNAGVGLIKPALEHSDGEWDSAFATNVTAAFALSTLVVSRQRAARPISIVNIGSPAAQSASRNTSAYAASKAALEQLTRVLALEWARRGVRVNCLQPGHFATELHPELTDQAQRDALAKQVPLGRIGAVEDLDATFLLLAGARAAYMTGATVAIDGGMGARGA